MKWDYVALGVGALVGIWAIKRAASLTSTIVSDAATAVGHAVNPLDEQNFANRGAVNVYQWVTGSSGTMGTDTYEVFHPNEGNPEEMQYGLDRMYELPPIL